MFKNYIKIAFRNLLKHKTYSFINISGLAIGITCCILILLFVQNELSYDRFNENADQIYRVTREWFNEDGETSLHLGFVAPPISPLLQSDFPDIIHSVRLLSSGGLVSYGEKHFQENRFFFAEKDVFNVFTFPFIKGNPQTALKDPFTIVITETTAKKYFGDEDPMDKVLNMKISGFDVNFKVTGITRDVPQNSHMHYDLLASFATYEGVGQDLQS